MPFNGILQDSVQIFGNDTFLEAMDDQTFGMITVQEREETTHLFESGGGGGGGGGRKKETVTICLCFACFVSMIMKAPPSLRDCYLNHTVSLLTMHLFLTFCVFSLYK